MLIVVPMKMKRFVITVAFLWIAFSVLADDPFDRIDTNRIVSVMVGQTESFAADPFADKPSNPPPPQFALYFELKDADTARKLAGLVKQMNKSADVGIPAVGVLSEQRFLDSASNVVFSTHIVNYQATVVVDSLESLGDAYRMTGKSKVFCRLIFDLMKTHCPKVIEKQEEVYGQRLEDLLFGKQEKEAQQGP